MTVLIFNHFRIVGTVNGIINVAVYLSCTNPKCKSKIDEEDEQCSRCQKSLNKDDKKFDFRFAIEVSDEKTEEEKLATGFGSCLAKFDLKVHDPEALEVELNELLEGKRILMNVRRDEFNLKEDDSENENEEFIIIDLQLNEA